MRRRIRQFVVGALVVTGTVALMVAAGAAAEPFVTYEDWRTDDHVRRDRWAITATPAQEVRSEQAGHALRLRLRREGGTASDVGFAVAALRAAMASAQAVDQIEATFVVKSMTVSACDGVPTSFSSALPAVITLNKLYDGTPRGPGQLTGDHLAILRALRMVGSTDPPGALRIQAGVFRCIDAVCSDAYSITGGVVELPDLVFVGEAFTLRLVWDEANRRFRVSLDNGPERDVPYPDTLTPAPGVPLAMVSMTAAGANCTAGAGVSDAETEVRTVRTNAGAVIP
jgi:hypothetical protein